MRGDQRAVQVQMTDELVNVRQGVRVGEMFAIEHQQVIQPGLDRHREVQGIHQCFCGHEILGEEDSGELFDIAHWRDDGH